MIKKSTYITSMLFAILVTIILTLTLADKARPVTVQDNTMVESTIVNVETVMNEDEAEDILQEVNDDVIEVNNEEITTEDTLVVDAADDTEESDYVLLEDTSSCDDIHLITYTEVTSKYSGVSSFKQKVFYNEDNNTYRVRIPYTTIILNLDGENYDVLDITHVSSKLDTRLDYTQVDWLDSESILTIDSCLVNIESNAFYITDAMLTDNIVDVTTNTGSTYTVDLQNKTLLE